ncbi:MAG: GIY-YIG nuclease family protein [Clostridia bacterium]|nr:GIY-YIG nuclease family protein [Clostridia bacterium]
MLLLQFSDILRKAEIDPTKTKLIRHALADEGFSKCYHAGLVDEYTAHQRKNFSSGYLYWAVFISDRGSYARFYALYRVVEEKPDTPDLKPHNWPNENDFQGEASFFTLHRENILEEYEGRILIDWGKSARMWHQKGTTEKPIIAIQSAQHKQFPGYDKVLLSFQELQEVVYNQTDFELWQNALSSVNAVYLIVDIETGKQYVGSAYGDGGLLGRWRAYVDTYHGGNKIMREVIQAKPEQYRNFQFSILQLLEKTATTEEVIQAEGLWKKKLMTVPFGLNAN